MSRVMTLLLLTACAGTPSGKPTAGTTDTAPSATPTTEPPAETGTLAPEALALCKPPLVTADHPLVWRATGLAAGEIAVFYRGDSLGAPETCFDEFGGLCTTLEAPIELGRAEADADGIAELVALLGPADVEAAEVDVQAFVDRGLSSASSNSTRSPWLPVGALARSCDDADVCTDLPDSDGDGVTDDCDRCPRSDDLADLDGDGRADDCDPLALSPAELHLVADAGETDQGFATVTSALPRDAAYSVSSPCDWLTVDTGGELPTEGIVPGRGVAQFTVHGDATHLLPGLQRCDLIVTTPYVEDALYTLPVLFEVTEPGLDLYFPPGDATTPTGLNNGLRVTVTDEAGTGLPGFRVGYTLLERRSGVTFAESGGITYDTVTGEDGIADATLVPPVDFVGTVNVDIVVMYPEADQILAEFQVERSWTLLQGDIYFWEIADGGGNIMKMPADFSAPPIVFDGTAHDGHCSGCHTASPGVLPTTGRPAVFTQDRTVSPHQEQVIDTETLEVVAAFEGNSSDNDWSPDSARITWSDTNVRVYDVVTGTNDAVPGADSAEYAEVFPTFSADGSHIAYTRCNGCGGDLTLAASAGLMSLWAVPSRGGEPVELVPEEPGVAIYYPEYSPDGRWLAFNKSTTNQSGVAPANTYSSSTAELWIVPVDPSGSRTTGPARRLDVANGEGVSANSWPTWAPDSSFIAFASTRNGVWDVFVSAISDEGVDSPATALPFASGPSGQHIPSWAP